MSDLPEFSARGTRPCEACGSTGISMEYRSHGTCIDNGNIIFGSNPNERMCRMCERCGFHWDERTLKNSPNTIKDLNKDLPPIARKYGA